MKKYALLIFFTIIFYSCKNNTEEKNSKVEIVSGNSDEIGKLQWLLGTWINESGEEYSQETWSKENDSTYTAFSFTQVGNETVFAETMALQQKSKNLLLTVANSVPTKESPVTFKMISSDGRLVVFENKNHDFPKRITYKNVANDSLHAWIEGQINGETKKVDFHFSRKN